MDRYSFSKSTYVSKDAAVLGEVYLGDNVFVAPTAVLRADETGSAIIVEDNCNIQDGVIIHALADTKVEVCNSTSLAHGCLVHGPCRIDEGSFIGFRSIVFKSELGMGTMVMHGAVVMNVKIPPRKLVPTGSVVDLQEKVDGLLDVSREEREFADDVVKTNLQLLRKYIGNP